MAITISGSGIVEANLADNAVTNVKIADNAVNIAEMATGTDGELITYDASGNPAKVAVGTVDHVLTSGGVGVAPTFQAAAGGGKVLQVVQYTSNSYYTAGSSYTQGPQSSTFSLSNSSNKVLVTIQWQSRIRSLGSDSYPDWQGNFGIWRGSIASGTPLFDGAMTGYHFYWNQDSSPALGDTYFGGHLSYLDTPGGNTTYSIGLKDTGTSQFRIEGGVTSSIITMMEIQA
jgi:hypothetical protein